MGSAVYEFAAEDVELGEVQIALVWGIQARDLMGVEVVQIGGEDRRFVVRKWDAFDNFPAPLFAQRGAKELGMVGDDRF